MAMAHDITYDLEVSEDIARLLLLAPESPDPKRHLSWSRENGIPLFAIDEKVIGRLPDSAKFLEARRISLDEEGSRKSSWLREYAALAGDLESRGIEIALIKTWDPFPFWSGNIDAIVKEEHFDEAVNALRKSGLVRLPWLDEPHKILFKRFENGRLKIELHLHSRIFWNSTFIRSDAVMRNAKIVDSQTPIKVISSGALIATTLAHAFIENSQIRAIDLLAVGKALRESESFDHAKQLAAEEGWTREFVLSARAFAAADEIASKEIGKGGFGISGRFSDLPKTTAMDEMFIRKVRESHGPPFRLPRTVTKGLLLKRSLANRERDAPPWEVGGVTGSCSMVMNFMRRKLKGDLVRGKIIAISGPDGSGKTTIAKELESALEEIGAPAEIYWSRYATVNPKVRSAFGRRSIGGGRDETGPSTRKRFPLEASIKIGMNIFQLSEKTAISRFFKKNIIFDRHFLDTQVDYLLDSAKKNDSLVIIGRKIIPNPDIQILLLSDQETLMARSRDELSIVSRRIDAYREFARNWPTAKVLRIDASREIGQIIDDLIPAVVNALS